MKMQNILLQHEYLFACLSAGSDTARVEFSLTGGVATSGIDSKRLEKTPPKWLLTLTGFTVGIHIIWRSARANGNDRFR